MADQDSPAITVDPDELVSPDTPLGTHYRISGLAGKGGMAEVLIARDDQLGRDVALKVLSRRSDATNRRFLVEARVTAQLDHPHIVPVHELKTTVDGSPAFTMKLIRGETLKSVLQQCKDGTGPELAERLELFVRICEAMAYAHERGVIHRDLKPTNVMIANHGELYVVDWGVAKVAGRPDEDPETLSEAHASSIHLTRTGAAIGTPSYMSPEQAKIETADPRSDIYALGLILQEMIVLHRANPGKTAHDAIAFATEAARTPFFEPPELAAIVNKACALERIDRYQTATELANEVRRYLRGEAIDALPDTLPKAVWRWTSKHPARTLTALGCILGIAAILTITSLYSGLRTKERDAARDRYLHDLTASVALHGHLIDVELLRYRGLLDGLADRAETLYDNGQPVDGPFYTGEDFRAGRVPPDTRTSPVYDGMAVSFVHPLAHAADGHPLSDRARALYPIREEMRTSFLRAQDETAVELKPAEQDRLLRVEGVPPSWVYVGLEDGVIYNYPGMGELSADYDPRKRPWYVSTQGTRGARWGAPYQDASGLAILLPCNRALYDDEGEFFGVAGFDVTLDTAIEMMRVEDDVPIASTWLVNRDGMVVVSSEQEGLNLGKGLHDNQALVSEPFPWAAARDRIMAGEDYGYVSERGGLVIFVGLEAIDWSFAVWVPR